MMKNYFKISVALVLVLALLCSSVFAESASQDNVIEAVFTVVENPEEAVLALLDFDFDHNALEMATRGSRAWTPQNTTPLNDRDIIRVPFRVKADALAGTYEIIPREAESLNAENQNVHGVKLSSTWVTVEYVMKDGKPVQRVTMKNVLTEREEQLAALIAQVADQAAQIEALQAQVASLNDEKENLNGQIGALTLGHNALQTALDEKTADLEAAQANARKQQEEYTALQATATKQKEDYDALQASASSAQKTQAAKISELETSLTAAQADAKKQHEENAALQASAAKQKEDYAALQDMYNTLKAKAEEAEKRVASLESEKKALLKQNYEYTEKDGKIRITKYKGNDTNVVVPVWIDGYPIAFIHRYAFYGCTSLTSISLPDTLTSISSYAFSACTGLISISLPDSLTSISSYAFSGCKSLVNISIPDAVTYIGKDAFKNCDKLTITVHKGSYAEKYCKENNLKYKTK